MKNKIKNKPKYVIYFVNSKNEEQVIGVANLESYNKFLFYLFSDKKIKIVQGFEYNQAKGLKLTDNLQITLLGPVKPKARKKVKS